MQFFFGRLIIVFLFFSFFTVGIAQDKNVFLERSYWKAQPTIEKIKSDIRSDKDLSEFNAYKFDAVTWAIIERVPNEVVWFLLKQNGNGVNKRSHDGRTPIFWAAYRGNIELMKALIDQGAATDLIDDHGYSLVNFAATTGQTDRKLYDLCITNGTDLTEEKNKDGATPLLLLIPHMESPEIINYFTDKGLSLETLDNQGNNAFVYAAKTGNSVMMDYLIENGFSPKANNSAAMVWAAKGTRNKTNTVETFQYLEQLGLAVNATDKKEKNALHYLASKCKDLDVLNYFLNQEENLFLEDKKGNSPLFYALMYNSIEVNQLFLNKKGHDHVLNNKGEYSIHVAVKRGDLELLKYVVELNGGLINKVTKDGLTPLHIAAMTSKDDIILKYLLSVGADSTIQTPFGERAIDLARENELLQKNKISIAFLE